MRPYLDSSIVIDAIDPTSAAYPKVSAALSSFKPGEFCINDLVRMECLIRPTRVQDIARLTALAAFFRTTALLPMASEVFNLAAGLRATYFSLKTPDALHLATALHHGCDEFWTNDLDLAKRNVGLTFRTF